jgi:hypothetical protein
MIPDGTMIPGGARHRLRASKLYEAAIVAARVSEAQ